MEIFTFSTGRTRTCFCIPDDLSLSNESDWPCKINIFAYRSIIRISTQNLDFYIKDLWDLIQSNKIELVNKTEFLDREMRMILDKIDEKFQVVGL